MQSVYCAASAALMSVSGAISGGIMAEQTCERCGGTGYVIVERDGFTGADRCSCFLDQIAEHRIPRAGIPEKFASASFDTFKIPDRVINPIANQALVPIFMDIRRYAR